MQKITIIVSSKFPESNVSSNIREKKLKYFSYLHESPANTTSNYKLLTQFR